jgi:serine O-acetyltransferase
VVGNPGHPVRVEGRRPEGPDADWVHLPDPIFDAIKGLAARIATLEEALHDDAARARLLEQTDARRAAEEDGSAEDSAAPTRSVGPNPAGG